MTPEEMAACIDHTNLKPQAGRKEILALCEEAMTLKTASVCVNPSYVKLAAQTLAGSGVTTCCVVGFPLGATTPNVKAFEAAEAVANGAREVDMVLNIGAVKSSDWALVERDIAAVVNAVDGQAKVKVILETCLLTEEEKVLSCQAAKRVGADFVKTSTGFSTGGATVEDVRLMRRTVGPNMGVKASGGVRTYEDAVAMLEAGATRLGASAGRAIIEGCK
ncbi:MAG: deoxyribose-phosphate aldolase [Oscillospiraceae bacterium]|nr:deoxyribose-phosphate aldolase [Oscillospiraceae bacterium]